MIRFAGFGRRGWGALLSWTIDLLVLWVLSWFVDGDHLAAPFITWYAIHHVGLVTEGGALGDRLVGLRVVSVSGERVPVLRAALREVLRLFVSLPPLGLGFLWMLDEPSRRTWHDLLAGTVVVRELAGSDVGAPAWAGEPPWRTNRSPIDGVAAGEPKGTSGSSDL
jgi:uncharacterized RDD family membrane protein YckC